VSFNETARCHAHASRGHVERFSTFHAQDKRGHGTAIQTAIKIELGIDFSSKERFLQKNLASFPKLRIITWVGPATPFIVSIPRAICSPNYCTNGMRWHNHFRPIPSPRFFSPTLVEDCGSSSNALILTKQ
jgi:hypothetical protein